MRGQVDIKDGLAPRGTCLTLEIAFSNRQGPPHTKLSCPRSSFPVLLSLSSLSTFIYSRCSFLFSYIYLSLQNFAVSRYQSPSPTIVKMKFSQSVVALVAAAGLSTASPVKRQAAPLTDADSMSSLHAILLPILDRIELTFVEQSLTMRSPWSTSRTNFTVRVWPTTPNSSSPPPVSTPPSTTT